MKLAVVVFLLSVIACDRYDCVASHKEERRVRDSIGVCVKYTGGVGFCTPGQGTVLTTHTQTVTVCDEWVKRGK